MGETRHGHSQWAYWVGSGEVHDHGVTVTDLDELAPARAHDPEFRSWWASYLRRSASPNAAVALGRMNTGIDIRDILPSVRVPTLILHGTGDRDAKLAEGHDRVLATFLFVDIVDSTKHVTELGDSAWRYRLEGIYAIAASEIGRFRDALRTLGVESRAGVHTGEIERTGSDVAGIALHVAARVMEKAGAGEVWTSSTVRDLASGSGLSFVDRGAHRLKGVSRDWQLFQAVF